MPKICWCGNPDLKDYNQDYYRCDACHTLVNRIDFDEAFNQVQDEEKDLYGAHYWTEEFLRQAAVESVPQLHDRYFTERTLYWLGYLLRHLLPPAKIAEIGCGMGQFPYLMKQAGFSQTAFELSPNICEYGKKVFALDMVCGTIDDRPGTYDCVIMMDLIEHILELDPFMQNILRHTKEDTLLFLQTPCYTPEWTYEQMLQSEPNFQNLLVPREHIFLFSKHSMRKFLAQYGYTSVQFHPALFGDHYDMFLVAGKFTVPEYTDAEIQDALDQKNQYVWLVRALLKQYREIRETADQTKAYVQSKDNYIEILEKKLPPLEDRIRSLEDTIQAEANAFEEERSHYRHQAMDQALQKQSLEQQLEASQSLYAEAQQHLQVAGEALQETHHRLQESSLELQHTQRKLQESSLELQDTQHRLQETSLELQDTQHRLQETSHELRDTSLELQDTQHTLRETSIALQDVQHTLQDIYQSRRWKLSHPGETYTKWKQSRLKA